MVWGHHAKCNKPVQRKILYDLTYMRYPEDLHRWDTEQWLPGENEALLSNGYSSSFIWWKVTGIDINGGDVCTRLWMYLITLNCTLKIAKMVNFMLHAFYNKKMEKQNLLKDILIQFS